MSAESYKRLGDKTRIGRISESAFRNADAAITAAQLLAIDLTTDDEVPFMEPILAQTEHSPIGAGRNAAYKVSYQGFDVAEETLPLMLQSAVQLYHALGSCVTVGTDLGVPFTDTIASGQGTAVVTMTTHTSMTPDEHIGRQFNDTTDSISYEIIDNDATTLTLHKAVGATADGNSCSITEAPFTHTISESNILPSEAFHIEMENPVDAESIRTDILGVIVNTLDHIFEKQADGIQNVGILAAKAVAGSDLAKPTDRSEQFLNWSHASTFTLSYNAANPVTADECNSVTISINNNAVERHAMGDENAKKRAPGVREYEITLHIFPENDTLRVLSTTKIQDYVTDLTFTFKVQTSADHSIQYTFDKLRVTEYPKSIPAKDEQEKGLDCKLRLAPGGTLAVVGIDSLTCRHYEEG